MPFVPVSLGPVPESSKTSQLPCLLICSRVNVPRSPGTPVPRSVPGNQGGQEREGKEGKKGGGEDKGRGLSPLANILEKNGSQNDCPTKPMLWMATFGQNHPSSFLNLISLAADISSYFAWWLWNFISLLSISFTTSLAPWGWQGGKFSLSRAGQDSTLCAVGGPVAEDWADIGVWKD